MFGNAGLLADHQILARLNRPAVQSEDQEFYDGFADDSIVVSPILNQATQLQQVSIDLRLGARIMSSKGVHVDLNENYDAHHMNNAYEMIELGGKSGYTNVRMHPGDTILWETLEYVRLPYDVAGKVMGKSTFGRLFLSVHVTAGLVDPGFKGKVTLELVNSGPHILNLHPGTRICQMTFYQMPGRVSRPYGFAHNNYPDSSTVKSPRINLDAAARQLIKAYRNHDIGDAQDAQAFIAGMTDKSDEKE